MAADNSGESQLTTDRETIRQWAEEHDVTPVRITETQTTVEDSNPYWLRTETERTGTMESVSWDEFFHEVEENDLVILFHGENADRPLEVVSRDDYVPELTATRDDYESELTATRDDIAAVLSGVVDGILAGSIRVGDGDDAVFVDTSEEITLEIELETEDDEVSLELELEWPHTESVESTAISTEDIPEENGDSSVPVGAAASSQMLARFEIYRDQGDEWRWRLRHRNGNIIATSGRSYTQKHNAQKSLRSVMQNATEAEIIDDSEY